VTGFSFRLGYRWSDRVPSETSSPRTVRSLPPNYETPELLAARHKPRLQHSLQQTAAASFGPVPFDGPEAEPMWIEFLEQLDCATHRRFPMPLAVAACHSMKQDGSQAD